MPAHDACTLLDDDHVKVEHLFTQYKDARDDNHKRMLARRICQELVVHTQIEEEIFYPAFRQAAGNEDLVNEAEHEHDERRQQIARIESRQVDDQAMLELEAAILHHVNDEREKMFPQARKTQGLDLMQLAEQLEARKAELTAGHPA